MSTLAPGARVVVRDAEWLIRSTKRASSGSQVFEAVGVSDFIKGKLAQFIADLETDLTVLDPQRLPRPPAAELRPVPQPIFTSARNPAGQ